MGHDQAAFPGGFCFLGCRQLKEPQSCPKGCELEDTPLFFTHLWGWRLLTPHLGLVKLKPNLMDKLQGET